MSELLVNKIRTPDGTILHSTNRHDYLTHFDRVSEETYMIDGGSDYSRRSVNQVPAESLCLYTDSPHEDIRQGYVWGTYGKNGDQPLRLVLMQDMDTDHIQAILKTQQLLPKVRLIFENELLFRTTA
jgi:hypothetical protein